MENIPVLIDGLIFCDRQCRRKLTVIYYVSNSCKTAKISQNKNPQESP